MAVGSMQILSSALERRVPYTIMLPDSTKVGPGPYPVLLQLHGRSDTHQAWLHKSNLLVYVENLPLIVVMPDGGNYMWGNLHPTLRYEDYIMQDLIPHITETYPVRGGKWAIGGLSMGGYGAIRLGLKYPDKFSSIYAHSSVIPTQDELERWSDLYTPERRADMDCYRWAAESDETAMARLSFDCGTEDQLLDHNRRFHAHLQKHDLPHNYAEYPGAHTWDYWDKHVQTALRQHAEVLGIQRVEAR